MTNQSANIRKMTLTAILVAIIFLLTFTPLGYLVIGPISATTIQMPVIIGAVFMGPATGTVLGFFFGLSALIKVLTMPAADIVATTALNTVPLNYIVICMGSRMAMGFLTGLIGTGLKKIGLTGNKSVLQYGITGFIGSLLNTAFYLGLLWLLAAAAIAESCQIDISATGPFAMSVAVSAGIPEAIVSCIVVTAVCKALSVAVFRKHPLD